MFARQTLQKRYNILKLINASSSEHVLVSHFYWSLSERGVSTSQLGISLFGCVTNRLPNSNERVHKPDCNSTVYKEISMQKLITLMATAISIIVNKCSDKVLVLGLTPSTSI